VYEWNDTTTGWDGTYKGSPVEGGVYVCMVTAIGADDTRYDKKGNITVIR
jgi:hypothetical protein